MQSASNRRAEKRRQSGDANAHRIMLQRLLDDALSNVEKYQTLYQEAKDKNQALEMQMQLPTHGSSTDEYSPTPFELTFPTYQRSSSRRFIRLRESLRAAEINVSSTKRKCSDLEVELLRKESDLAATQAECESASISP